MVTEELLGLNLRQPPANLEAEQGLLGAILANPKALDRVFQFLKPEHFADPFHGRLYGEILRLSALGQVTDPITLRPWLEAQPDAAEVGGVAYLAELLSAMVGIINAGDYGRQIQEAWARRMIIDVAESMVHEAFGAQIPAAELVARVTGELDDVLLKHGSASDMTLGDAASKVIDGIAAAQRGEAQPLFSTGISELDEILGGGLKPMDFSVLAGRPGHGKSALARQMSISIAKQYGLPVLFQSLEMTTHDQAASALGSHVGLSAERIEAGHFRVAEADLLVQTQREFQKLKYVIDERPKLSLAQIKLSVRRFKRRFVRPGQPFLLVVDHIHLMALDNKLVRSGGIPFAVGENANGLKELAKDENAVVLGLAQLSRSKEGADDKVPTLADLKYSGDIEAAADKVFFTHRPELHLHKAKPTRKPNESDSEYFGREAAWQQLLQSVEGLAVILSAKLRRGQLGAIEMKFDGPTTSFLTKF